MLYALAVVCGFALGVASCFFLMWKFAIRVAKNKERRIAMFRSYFYTLDRWLTVRRHSFPLGRWLADTKQVHTIALYGVGVLGRQFVAELSEGPVTIIYAIDQSVTNAEFAFPVYRLEESLPEADLVVVTPAYDFDEIKEKLSRKISCPILSAEALIKEYYRDGAQS